MPISASLWSQLPSRDRGVVGGGGWRGGVAAADGDCGSQLAKLYCQLTIFKRFIEERSEGERWDQWQKTPPHNCEDSNQLTC